MPQPGTNPVPVPAPGITPGASALGDNEVTSWALGTSTSVEDILQAYERLTGKRVIRDAGLAQGVMLTIKVNGPIKKGEAVRLIESTLLLNGFALVPGPDGNVKAINMSTNKNPRAEGIPIYANAASLPEGDHIVSYFMALRYMSAAEAATIFQTHIVPHQPQQFGMIVPVANAQALIITESTAIIRQLIQLQKLIDVPPAKVVSEFIVLQRADAERVADVLTKMLEARRNSQTALGQPPTPSPETSDEGSVMNERNIVAGTVQLIPDARTNRILIVTRPINFSYIKSLILAFDESANVTAPFERPLKYVSSGDVLPVLQKALAETKEDAQGAAAPGQNNQNRNNNNRSGSSSSSSSSSTNSNASDSVQASNQDTAPDSVIVGKTKLIADKRANSILVIGPPESVSRVADILDKLDTAPRQVYLATVIGELSLINDTEFGVDLLQKWSGGPNSGVASQLRNTASAANNTSIDPRTLTSAASFPTTAGLTVYGAVGSTLNYYVTALESSNRFKILSRPSVYISNNQKATISSGQQVPVPGTTESTVNSGTTNNAVVSATVEYKNVDLELSVVPLINADKQVTLQIGQDNNTLGSTSNIGGNLVPAINTQHFTTQVTVPNRQTVVLGGLIVNNIERDTSGTLWLSDIPVIGLLFKDTVKKFTRREIIILIEPNVIDSEAELIAASQEEHDRSLISSDALHMNGHGVYVPNDQILLPKPPKPQKNAQQNVKNTQPAVPTTTTTVTTTQSTPLSSDTPLPSLP